MKDFTAMPLDFESWTRENLVRLVQDLWAQNKQLRVDNKELHELLRQELKGQVQHDQ